MGTLQNPTPSPYPSRNSPPSIVKLNPSPPTMGTLQNPTPSPYPSLNPNISSQPNPNTKSTSSPNSPSFDEVSNLFSFPLSDAADSLGVCTTVLKKVCYDNGLVRWPYRKFLSGKSIEEIKKDAAIEKVKKLDKLAKVAGEENEALASLTVSTSSGSQPQNKSSGPPLETSAPRTITQKPSKDAQIESSHDAHGSNSTKANSSGVDEFKYGFPSEGLSSISYKWWENESSGGNGLPRDGEDANERKQQAKELADDDANVSSLDGEISEGKTNKTEADSQWTSLLSALRKKAVKDGQQALKLGVYKGYGVQKLDQTKRMVLAQIFKSSLPGEWGDLSSES